MYYGDFHSEVSLTAYNLIVNLIGNMYKSYYPTDHEQHTLNQTSQNDLQLT